MELDLQSFIWAPSAQLYSLAETPQLLPHPTPHSGSSMMALLVSQDRRHFFVTPSVPYAYAQGGRHVLLKNWLVFNNVKSDVILSKFSICFKHLCNVHPPFFSGQEDI
jgi:hypothetical protein